MSRRKATEDDDLQPPKYVQRSAEMTDQPDTRQQPVDYAERTTWWKRRKLKKPKYKAQAWLVNMELSNGKHISMVMFATEDSFIYAKRRYVIDSSLCYYHLSSGLYALDYHEELALPLKRHFDAIEIKKAIAAARAIEEQNLINPILLQQWKKSRLHEMVLRGGAIDAFLRQIRILIWVLLVLVFVHLLIFIIKSGMLSKIRLPGT